MFHVYHSKLNLVPQMIRDRYNLHMAISNAFHGRNLHPQNNRVLWRVVNQESLLVQSEEDPNWKYFTEQRLLKCPAETQQVMIHPRTGHCYNFVLDGNTVSRHEGRATAIRDQDGQKRWLAGQLERSGMRLVHCTVTSIEVLRMPKKADTNMMTIFSCCYKGQLQILHVDRAIEGLRRGIGRAKFAGLGLLMIEPTG